MSVHKCQPLGSHFFLHPFQIGHIVKTLADQTCGIDQVFRAVCRKFVHDPGTHFFADFFKVIEIGNRNGIHIFPHRLYGV